ncbi:hypothetical protein BDI01nite_20400 [Brevundimonas diminuta]|uniref:hypothetical protein n=1 Tax=Brevundimonas diminuta TaxID=293 RepID=UPI000925C3AC|nr:hypothetical protein [Brevundimonas diminuta]OJU53870.1 MAG: hypothetical protein BGO02_01925 [Brevundimonas sp. 67-6]GEC00976.1 hypothetical protein BDI01nite_20400 [Brevundimonas diminuta]
MYQSLRNGRVGSAYPAVGFQVEQAGGVDEAVISISDEIEHDDVFANDSQMDIGGGPQFGRHDGCLVAEPRR